MDYLCHFYFVTLKLFGLHLDPEKDQRKKKKEKGNVGYCLRKEYVVKQFFSIFIFSPEICEIQAQPSCFKSVF